jgi:hypothetical protein
MSTSSKPLFFADHTISWNAYLPNTTPVSRDTAIHVLFGDSNDPRMVNVWHDLYELSRAANIAAQAGRKLESNLLEDVMISVQYRLLLLQYDDEDLHEILRVVMLAYSTTILPLLFSQYDSVTANFSSTSSGLQRFLSASKKLLAETLPVEKMPVEKLKVLLWLLVVVRITMSDNELIDFQLGKTIQFLNLSSWDEILVILKGFLWVEVLHIEQTKRIFDEILPI